MHPVMCLGVAAHKSSNWVRLFMWYLPGLCTALSRIYYVDMAELSECGAPPNNQSGEEGLSPSPTVSGTVQKLAWGVRSDTGQR